MSITTVEPVRAAKLTTNAPEFLDSAGVEAHFGLKKSILWRLLGEGKIRGITIRKRGRARGKRLFDCDSIRKFLLANVDVEPVAKQGE